jgi:hypothetical protein
MDEIFGDQLVPHALEDPVGAEAAMSGSDEKGWVQTVHDENV